MARISEADQAVWAAYARGVKPLPGRPAPSPPRSADPHVAAAAPPMRPVPRATAAGKFAVTIGEQPGGLDAATWHRFRSGRMAPTRRLDLHGYTAQRAFLALSHFLKLAQAEHVRCVEIVTGRGSGEGTGVIRRELPHWLGLPDLRPMVLASVHPHAANPGAVRLLLRRVRG